MLPGTLKKKHQAPNVCGSKSKHVVLELQAREKPNLKAEISPN